MRIVDYTSDGQAGVKMIRTNAPFTIVGDGGFGTDLKAAIVLWDGLQLAATKVSDLAITAVAPVEHGCAPITVTVNGVSAVGPLLAVAYPDPIAPTLAPPTNLLAVAISSSVVAISWGDPNGKLAETRLERRSGTLPFTEIAIAAPGGLGFTNVGLAAGVDYTYRARAASGANFSPYTPEVKVTTKPAADVMIDSLEPSHGIGGTIVTVTGHGFGANPSIIVTIGNPKVLYRLLAAEILEHSDTLLRFIMPKGVATGPLFVRNFSLAANKSNEAIWMVDSPPPPPVGNKPPVANAGGPYTGIVGATIQFDGSRSSDPDGKIVNYSWNFGNGATSPFAQSGQSYAIPGVFTVTLTVTDDKGATATATTTATITAAPLPSPTDDLTEVRKVITLVNAERAKAGLTALRIIEDTLPDPNQQLSWDNWKGRVNRLEARLAELGNSSLALSGLVENGPIMKAAQKYAQVLVDTNTFSHVGPDGSSVGDRLRREGWAGVAWGENIANGYYDAVAVMAGWMSSAGHQANILDPHFTAIGVGKVGLMWVMDLGNLTDTPPVPSGGSLEDVFEALGTLEEKELLLSSLRQVAFPWNTMKAKLQSSGIPKIQLRFNDLSPYGALLTTASGSRLTHFTMVNDDGETDEHFHASYLNQIPGLPDETRRYVAGLASRGQIQIEQRLKTEPTTVQVVVSAEVAHEIMEWFYGTEEMHTQLLALTKDPLPWWHGSYSDLYFEQGGENIMAGIGLAYGPSTSQEDHRFAHWYTRAMAPDVRRILGLSRTDGK